MAQGTVSTYDAFMDSLSAGEHLWNSTDTYYCAIVDNTAANFDQTTADPHWGGTGTTDLSANECTPNGAFFPVDGRTCDVGTGATGGANTWELDLTDPATWGVDSSNPVNCYYGVVYNFTDAAKKCVAFVDLGGIFDATTGDLTITWGAPFIDMSNV
jgi:hypothetical protein